MEKKFQQIKSSHFINALYVDTPERVEALTYLILHWYINNPSCNNHQSTMKYISNIDTTKYHVYSISWDESTIKWYVDDIQYSEVNIKDMDSFHKPFYIILNLAVGGSWPKRLIVQQ